MTPTPETALLDLSGKAILITGGASGIGAETARLLTGLGAKVVIAGCDAEGLPKACRDTGAVHAVQGDVTREQDCARMVAETIATCGRIDGMVNSAGIGDDLVPVHLQSPARWQHVVDVNLKGTYLICRAAGREMLAQGGGAIVNIASITGLDAFPGRSAYGVAKAGVVHLTKTLACEWGPKGVRVNAIAPAYTITPMVRDLLDRGVFDPKLIERRTPLGRMAHAREMATCIAFLLSPMASYITGVTLPVDGGWGAYGAAGDVDKTPAGGTD